MMISRFVYGCALLLISGSLLAGNYNYKKYKYKKRRVRKTASQMETELPKVKKSSSKADIFNLSLGVSTEIVEFDKVMSKNESVHLDSNADDNNLTGLAIRVGEEFTMGNYFSMTLGQRFRFASTSSYDSKTSDYTSSDGYVDNGYWQDTETRLYDAALSHSFNLNFRTRAGHFQPYIAGMVGIGSLEAEVDRNYYNVDSTDEDYLAEMSYTSVGGSIGFNYIFRFGLMIAARYTIEDFSFDEVEYSGNTIVEEGEEREATAWIRNNDLKLRTNTVSIGVGYHF